MVSRKLKGFKSKKGTSIFVEDNPEHFQPHFENYLDAKGAKIRSYEDFINRFRQYMSGSNYDDAPASEQPNEATLLPLYKGMKTRIVADIQETNGIPKAAAESKFKEPIIREKVIVEKPKVIGYAKGVRVDAVQGTYRTKTGKEVLYLRDKKTGRFVSRSK